MTEVIIRELEENDLFDGFLESLDSLRKASTLSKEKARKIYEIIKSNQNHVVLVAVLDGKVIGSTTMIFEQKFIHDGGIVCHIEDVVVSKNHQGKRIGEKLIKFCLDFARKRNCYKTILDCSEEVKPFYEKIGFKKHSYCMRFDH